MRKRIVSLAAGALAVGLVAPAAVAAPTEAASLTAAESIGATDLWAQGFTGEGVGVAIVDTGVSPHPVLGDRIAAQIDLSGPGKATDGHGHGTFLAGLVVGQEGPDGQPLGVAPDAHVVSVKVADADGNTTLEQVLAGLALVRATAEDFNTRVVVLALGGRADEVPDPIEEALEDLWAAGFVVVVASGNDAGTVAEPGVSPYLLTVGSTNDRGTASPQDDVVAVFSGSGEGRDGSPKPDVLAPGASLASARIPGSSADRENPDSRIDGRWFRGSGTSMSAAVAGGAAALLLDADPTLTNDEVKGRLMASASPVAGAATGSLNLVSALAADEAPAANAHLPSLSSPESVDPPTTDADWQGKSWSGKSWSGKSWSGKSWSGKSWSDDSWIGKSWSGSTWIGKSWSADHWLGRSWS